MSTRLWLSEARTILLFLCLIQNVNAQQVLQTNRFEIPSPRDERNFEVIPAREQGIFLYRRLTGTSTDHIEIIKLDTAFKEVWKGYLPVDRRYVLMGKKVENGKLYFLLRYIDYSKNNFELFAIEETSGNFIKYSIRNFIPFSPAEFQVTEKAAIMGGYYNQVPVVMYYSFETEKSRVLPGLLNENGELTQVKVYPDGTFDVLISARNFKGQQTVWIKNYDADGNLQTNFALEPEDSKHLIFARSIKTSNNMQLVAGVFGGRNSLYSRGIFLASIDPTGMEQLRYYNYGDLEHFFNYMTAKHEQRVKERIERRKIKGKKTKFNYRFLVHEIVPYKNQYVLLGEAFYPKYVSTGSAGSYSGFFSPTAYSYNTIIRDGRIFDGYHYTHAVVMGFDLNGKLLWDNSFEINDVKTYTLEQFVKLEVQDDKIALLYLYDNELRTKIIQDDKVLEGKTFEPIKVNDNDEIKRDIMSFSKLDYWYHDFFYAYGVQEISNPGSGKRRVFYINKIAYR